MIHSLAFSAEYILMLAAVACVFKRRLRVAVILAGVIVALTVIDHFVFGGTPWKA